MSLRVVHTFGRNAGAVEVIDKPVVRIGRAPDNEIAFDPEYDRDASGHHAEVRLGAEGWVLLDLGSRNGTWIAGRRVLRHVLAYGDEVTFGAKGPRVRFEVLAPPPAAAQPAPPAPAAAPPAQHPAPEAIAAFMATPTARHASDAPRGGTVAMDAKPEPPPPAPAPPADPPRMPRGSTAPMDVAPQPRAPAPAPAPAFAPAPAAAAAPPLAPPAGSRRVGQRTMAMMISSAVSAATGRARPRRTVEIEAMVDQQVSAATAGHRRTTYLLGLLLVVAIASLVGLVLYNRSSQSEIQRLREDLARLPPEDPRRKEIESRLGSLHPPNANFGRTLYDRSRKGIFMLAARGEGFCTAFAVRPSVLATNAHCIVAARRRGGTVVALENEGAGQVSFQVTEMRPHPQYRADDPDHLTPDVGVLKIGGRAAVVLELANAQELAAAGAGEEVYLIGFPGRLMDPTNPAATFLDAHIGRVTNAAGRPAPFADAWLFQHDAPTTHGTSGSPVFNGRGKVIAVNAGGYLEGEDETISGKKTEVVKASPYKFGMRVDLLESILR